MENVASRFGQRLAHTEKKYRDQALKKLSLYLTKRSEWSELEWDKLWKALFYCMWMSDKRPIQDELSTNLASLIHKIPSPEDALGFVHSFFRTMHREWHGIDGLRLDKFYALIRKFVHQSLLLLQNHEWETELVEQFVSMVSTEVMSQLPNGLRLHLTDLFLTELYASSHESVDTDTFLLLLEPFFTLLSSEYDKTVFKRVRELVFLPMLSTYKFGKQPEKKKSLKKKNAKENDETDEEEDEEEEEEPKVFALVQLAPVQHRIFAIASADDTAERNRSVLYEMYSHFFRMTKVDSLKFAQEEAKNPTPKVTKKRKQPDAEETEPVDAAVADETKAKKKNKRRKKSKQTEAEAEPEQEDEPVKKAEKDVEMEVATPEKKSKKNKTTETTKTPVNTPTKTSSSEETTLTKKQKKTAAKQAEDVVMEVAKVLEVATPEDKKAKKKAAKQAEAVKKEEETTPMKKEKKVKKEEPAAVVVEKKEKAKKQADKPVEVKKEAPVKKAAADNNLVVRSGMKMRRCGACGGVGKGLVPVGKELCRHCERTGAQKKKEHVANKKAAKRKADEMASASASASTSDDAKSKKVTFGKNRALAHELSVKRLRASAKEPATKELTDDHKGVLRVKAVAATSAATTKTTTANKKKTGGRMKAADFF